MLHFRFSWTHLFERTCGMGIFVNSDTRAAGLGSVAGDQAPHQQVLVRDRVKTASGE
jgi:hypothetical protein